MFPVTITINDSRELNLVLNALNTSNPQPAERKVEAPKAETPKAEKPKAEPKVEAPKPAATSPAPSATAPTASSEKPAGSVDYPTLQKAVFALANASREAAGEVAAGFGVKTFKELDASKWGDALAAVNAKLESLQVA